MVTSHYLSPSSPPPIGIECVPERMAKRPVMIAERLGVHCEVKQPRTLGGYLIDAGRRRASKDSTPVTARLAITKVVHQNENDVGFPAVT